MITTLLVLSLQSIAIPEAPQQPVLEPEERLEARLEALQSADEGEAADIAQEVLALWADADSATSRRPSRRRHWSKAAHSTWRVRATRAR